MLRIIHKAQANLHRRMIGGNEITAATTPKNPATKKVTQCLHTKGHAKSHQGPRTTVPTARVLKWVSLFAVAAAVAIALGFSVKPVPLLFQPAAKNSRNEPGNKPRTTAPRNLAELIALQPDKVKGVDIALMNLLCAEGLAGAEKLDVAEYLKRLDGTASRVDSETKRHYYKFRDKPEEFNHSEGYFRMLLMAVVLQEDLRIQYNPARITEVGEFEPNEVFFADSRDVFIHGLMSDDRRMGTCSSLPVLYVAIGRRLGYPLKLVPTQNHLFVRWEDSRERFNVDATGRGMNMYDDSHYRQWPFPIAPEEEQEFGYLKSMTAAEELSAFLGLRGHCLLAMGRPQEGLSAHEKALALCPNARAQQLILIKVKEQLQAPTPTAFLPPEARDPYWPRVTPSVAGTPADPNPLGRIRNP